MLPSTPFADGSDSRVADAVLACNGSSASRVVADGSCLVGSESGVVASLTPLQSPFGSRVAHVVGLGSKEQMVRVHASRSVAPMAQISTFWNRADVHFVGHSVGESRAPRLGRTEHQSSVPGLVHGPCPHPASCNRINGDVLHQSCFHVVADLDRPGSFVPAECSAVVRIAHTARHCRPVATIYRAHSPIVSEVSCGAFG